MKLTHISAWALVLGMGAAAMGQLRASQLRCEYLTDPAGIQDQRPRLSWIVESSHRGAAQTAYQVHVASSEDKLSAGMADLWDSGRVTSNQTVHVRYAGRPLRSGTEAHWQVRVWDAAGQASSWSEPARWRMGLLEPADWKARWIGKSDPPPDGPLPALPAAMLRKSFTLGGADGGPAVERAVVSVSALGLYELRINGQRVGDQVLAPEWTSYHNRVQYQTYDVTPLLRPGENVIGAHLGDGWYAGRIGISHIVPDGPLRGHYGKHPRLLMQMEIALADGSRKTVVTDQTWRSTTDGPIRKSCILDGEVYDARKERPGWDQPGYDDSGWQGVDVAGSMPMALIAQPNEPMRVTQELRPVNITEPAPGVYVFDFGQNMAGWCRLSVSGSAGTSLRIRHAEVLDEDGNIYRDNLRMEALGGELGARAENHYTLRGEGTEVYEPYFTYHGFRYVEVVGLPERPSSDLLTARVFHSDAPIVGRFESSSPLLNQIMTNILWTLRSNLPSIPTDCPQRDERTGWTGDILAFGQAACFKMDMAALYTKWLQDVRDDQADDGRYPDFAPHPFGPNERFSGVPAWGDAGVFVPWYAYVNYGDLDLLRTHFESARRWVDWIHSNNPDLIWRNKRHNDYGDWLNGDTLKLEGYGFPTGSADLPREILATAFFHQSTRLVGRMAGLIGREDDARKYAKLADDIREAFVSAYISDDGTIQSNTQSAYALALDFDLVPANLREDAAGHMVKAIEDYKWHISTGFHTTTRLMNQLTAAGRNDVAWRLINNRTIPSWGYSIDQGATTIWERWDGYVKGRGFQDPGMNSFNHYALGAVGEWMYRSILGINPDEESPSYQHIILRPEPGGGVTWARGHYDSIRGRIASEWRIEDGNLEVNVTVPANTTATIFIPARDPAAITEGGTPVSELQDIRFREMTRGKARFEIGSGSYRFLSRDYESSE